MTDVFISYTREDDGRVAPIVEGLQAAGLSAWWDRAIPGGESWRQQILGHLENARCVVVIWSANSVGPAGEFVHEEAAHAKSRGVLLPIRIDRVVPPLGFGELQALDLIGWNGKTRDARFQDVVAAARAMVAGHPRPHPSAPGRRLRFATAISGALATLALVLGFVLDVAGLQAGVCRIPVVRAGCARLGLGGVPTPAEEAIWRARSAGDCTSLRDYVARFPKGTYAEEAAHRLQAAERRDEEHFSSEERRLPLTVRPTLAALRNESVARADALARAPEDARLLCGGFSVGGDQLISSSVEVLEWRCSPRDGGSVCGFDGKAVCNLSVRHVQQREICQ